MYSNPEYAQARKCGNNELQSCSGAVGRVRFLKVAGRLETGGNRCCERCCDVQLLCRCKELNDDVRSHLAAGGVCISDPW